jgi:diguanylate cyclase (GGDEF)-like protein
MHPARRGSVLIVLADRTARRVLFDVLDAHGFDAIHTASNPAQARGMLERDTSIDLVLLEHPEHGDAAALCLELAAAPACNAIRVVGIAPPERGQARNEASTRAAVHAWIASPLDPREIAGLLARLGDGPAPARPEPESGASYRFAFEGGPDGHLLVDPASGLILDANETLLQHRGVSRASVVGNRIDAFDGIASRTQRQILVRKMGAEGGVRYRTRQARGSGEERALDVRVRLVSHDGRAAHLYVFRDADESTVWAEALSIVTDLAREAAAGASIGAGLRGLIDRMALDFAMFAHRPAGTGGEPRTLALYQRDSAATVLPEALLLARLKPVFDGAEIIAPGGKPDADDAALLAGSGFACVIALPLTGDAQTGNGALVLARRQALADAEPLVVAIRALGHQWMLQLAIRQAREEGRSVGMQDVLTTLPNRLLFNDRLEATLQEAHRTGEMFAVAFVDVDRFKNINDSLGHAAGDRVLAAVADRLRASVRPSDTIARYAGDEFTVILRHVAQREEALRVADKIVRAMATPLRISAEVELRITVSLGLAFYPDDAANAERLLKQADMAMYAAKDLGRNTYQAYVAMPEESSRQRLALEARLHRAEQNGELRVHYQPQVHADTEDLVGAEALLRWQHPELGMISPGFFIPLAEEIGTILAIGEWILRAACADARRWRQRFGLPLRVGVNLSPLQLRQPSLVARVALIFEETGVDPSAIEFEVTESINIKAIPNLLGTLNGLRALGCQISIDDFGTGQSSLDYLKHFPADRIKIDQGFVRNIGVDPDDEAIVRATISMAHNLNREVVAEGVESETHLEFLKAHGCDALQGYLFCRPLPPDQFESLLVERERLRSDATRSSPEA